MQEESVYFGLNKMCDNLLRLKIFLVGEIPQNRRQKPW